MMPYLAVEDPDGLVQFVKTAFDAECVHQLLNEDGSVYHSEFRIGSAHFMIGRVPPDAPRRRAGTRLTIPGSALNQTFDKTGKYRGTAADT